MFEDLFQKRNHLPFYFLLVRIWSTIGESEFVLRYFSTILSVLSIALIFSVGRLLAGPRVGFVAALLLSISPFHIWYSQEARMYTLMTVSVLAAHWFLFRLLRTGRPGYLLG